MITINGTGVFGGVAFGRIAFYRRRENLVKRVRVGAAAAEVERFLAAREVATEDLKALYEKALAEVGEANAVIFQIHQIMLEDGDYCDSITNIITAQSVNAEYAVATTGDNFSRMFASMEDDYMKARAADIKDISARLVRILCNAREQTMDSGGPVILAADDLAPSETVQLNKEKILAFVTARGSANSHTAILSKMMNIPAVIGTGEALREEYDGKEAIVDGFTGTVYIEPDVETAKEMKEKAAVQAEKKRLLNQLRGKENKTLDGCVVEVFANISSVADAASVLQNDAGGVGLFRSEFLYLKSEDYPTEIEQFQAYKLVAENMAGKKVVIRTLDIGADKQAGYFKLPKEENPAMGYRAIRVCLDRPEIFKTQLRALCRASAFGNIAVMFPMITSVEEILTVKRMLREVRAELYAGGISYSDTMEIGVMIETPAAVMISDLLAREVDFFSIGTNDLTQYSLAIDRQNPMLNKFYNPRHKGLLRMIKMVADNAHAQGKWVGICGELAADLELTGTFLAMGVDELSVSPPFILPLREKIRRINVSECKADALSEL